MPRMKINSLQSLRFIMALMIFHHHFFYEPNYVQIVQFGTFPVTFFFILSGFMMSLGYADKVEAGNFDYRKYLCKRLIRICPLNFICLALILLVPLITDIYHADYYLMVKRLASVVPSALLIQSWIPIQKVYFSGNAAAWFLSDILFCYVVFPWLIRFCAQNHKLIKLLVILVVYFCIVTTIPYEYVHTFVYINPLFRIVDFVVGIEVYILFRKLSQQSIKASFLTKTAVELLVCLFAAAVMLLFPLVPIRFSYVSLFWLPSAAIILIFALYAKSGGGISRILSLRVLVYFGTLSFTFYMLHMIIRNWYNLIEGEFLGEGYHEIGAVICVIVLLLMSHVYAKYVEPYIVKKLNCLYEKG